MKQIPRPEYPRPQYVRADWLNLNGDWAFDFDDTDTGLKDRWFDQPDFGQTIAVPFPFQSPLSGIGTNDFHDVVWYARQFRVPDGWAENRLLLNFGAVDYRAQVWVNGVPVGSHEGGHTPFTIDITPYVNGSDNTLVLRIEDESSDRQQPRGKQYWKQDSASIFYTRTTGIWQTVWLEPVSDCYLKTARITPDIDANGVHLAFELGGEQPEEVIIETEIRYSQQVIASGQVTVTRDEDNNAPTTHTITWDGETHLWSPEQPNLYDITFTLHHGEQSLDTVESYFGLRKIDIQDGKVCLNNAPYYMRLVLDQGYHPQGILTFPTDADFKQDIELTKAMNFNGVRKHQKIEDPRYLYWADKLGLLVWGEMANAYDFSPTAVQRITQEWQAAVLRDYNHPCIVAWVPLNESWGVPDLTNDARQRHHLQALVALTRTLDTSRLVISNDGWEHVPADLLTIHDYESQGNVLRERYADLESTLAAKPARRALYATGFSHSGEPILLTEFGGVAYRKSQQEGWGYSTAQDEADFLARYAEIMQAVVASPVLQGYCYTQLTDVEQEINGLLTYDRQPKADLDAIAKINRVTG